MNEELIRELEGVSVSKNVFLKSKDCITNYWTHSDDLIIKKIIRNWVLADKLSSCEGFESRKYGNVEMILDTKTNVIFNLRNSNNDIYEMVCDKQLKKEVNKYMGIDQLLIEQGIKRSELVHDLPIFSRNVYNKTVKFVKKGTYLETRRLYGKLIKNGTVIEEGISENDKPYKYILTDIGTVKVFSKNNYISYVDFNDEIMSKTREEVA